MEPLVDPLMLEAIAQYLVIPVLAWLWVHDRKLAAQDREIAKLIVILEERNSRRSEDREEFHQSVKKLHEAIERLDQKLGRETIELPNRPK